MISSKTPKQILFKITHGVDNLSFHFACDANTMTINCEVVSLHWQMVASSFIFKKWNHGLHGPCDFEFIKFKKPLANSQCTC